MTDILMSRGIGKLRICAGSARWIQRHCSKFMETPVNIKKKVRMSELEDKVPLIIWIVSDKIDPRSGLYCN